MCLRLGDAIKLLNKFDELGKDFNLLNGAKKHTYKELFIKYMDKKIVDISVWYIS
ncbi:Uncharacterised protein [Campylobacter devanensis]|uniref:hypothetical protein n=1 Tax=Campylobacter devanensis TaxID=3161138 RepID=UPI000E169F32|nr:MULTISPECIES: hypothetical protein [Campylobacter]SUX01570.1 Uncharacterised protein [Campylobacter lanienae]